MSTYFQLSNQATQFLKTLANPAVLTNIIYISAVQTIIKWPKSSALLIISNPFETKVIEIFTCKHLRWLRPCAKAPSKNCQLAAFTFSLLQQITLLWFYFFHSLFSICFFLQYLQLKRVNVTSTEKVLPKCLQFEQRYLIMFVLLGV